MLTYGTNIPLFPLSVVLFPGMMLPLHIFEKRYQVMIRECIDSPNQMFGVILAKTTQAQAPGVANLYADDLHEIGTTARITAVEQLQDGRMNLITVGQERFVIKSIRASETDFLIGQVDPFPMKEDGNPEEIDRMTKKLRGMVKSYIDQLASASGEDLSSVTLPTDPKTLAYLAGTAIQGPLLQDKQQLLSIESVSSLIVKTVNVLDKESQILGYMLRAYQAHQQVQKLPFVDYSLN
jgi:Lon protease-like protein